MSEPGPLHRILSQLDTPGLLDELAERLPGADLTTLLLELMRRRAGQLAPADVVRRYREDRFVAPGHVPFDALRHVEDSLVGSLPEAYEMVVLAPVVPLGTHSVLGTVDQNNVVSTVRQSEVAADPTNALALEAAARRRDHLDRDPRSNHRVALAASQRVVRAQAVEGPALFAHFHLFAMVTAGRDEGHHTLERETACEHIRFQAASLLAAGAEQVDVKLSDFTGGRMHRIHEAVRTSLATLPGTSVADDPDRQSGRGYYAGFCFKVHARFGDEAPVEVGDGGLTDWTQQLLGSRKERLFTSGMGIERIATGVRRS